jgi:hypothetical protein
MNNEPVAWMFQDDEGRSVSIYRDTLPCDAIPLYLHPVKELTDEEIISTMVQFDVYSSDDHCLIEAGRAILRKAQENG